MKKYLVILPIAALMFTGLKSFASDDPHDEQHPDDLPAREGQPYQPPLPSQDGDFWQNNMPDYGSENDKYPSERDKYNDK
jgi:hypothetical protein